MKKNITILLFTIISLFSFQQSYANIAEGEVGTCIWYITDEGELVIAPANGVSGDLPEESWNYGVCWGGNRYSENVFTAKVMPGVNAKSCESMFSTLSKMTSVDLSGLNTQNATSMRSMFEGCYSLTSLDLSNFNTENVTDMSWMFSSCSHLTSLDLSNFNTENVTKMSGMFSSCSSLTSLDLSNFNTEKVTDTSDMFFFCYDLIFLNLSNFNTQNVTSMAHMFQYCSSLNTIISNRETPSTLKAGTFSESFDNRANCTLFIPEGSEELYAATDGWNELGKTDDIIFNDSTGTIYIAQGGVGTCIWYITDEGELVIAPADGVSGDLPEEGWESRNDNGYFTSAPWGVYHDNIVSLKVMSGVNAKSCNFIFYNLKKMTSVDLSGLNTENATSMRSMFEDCSSLTSLDLSNFNTENVTDMTYMFSHCSSLTSLDLSNFNTENATSMRSMFSSCSHLTSLDLSNFNTENVTNMSWMFGYCSSLTSLDLSNFNTGNVTNMEYMFCHCSHLTSLDLSNFNMQNVTNMSDMFTECPALTIIISNRETPSILKAGTFSSFENRANCNLLVPAGSEELYAAADGWNELSKINDVTPDVNPQIPEDAIASGETGTCIWYITSDNELVIAPADGVSGDLPEDGWLQYDEEWNLVRAIPWREYSQSIFSARIMPGVNTTTCSYMFYGLDKMTSADLTGLNTENAKDMWNMFYGCSSLTSLDLSNLNTQNVETMENIFYGCSSLTSLDISNFDTKSVAVMEGMFSDCSSLTSLDLGNFDTNNVAVLSHMFAGCSSLTSLDLSNFNTENVTKMRRMFMDCSSLTSLDLSNFNTENVTEMWGLFEGCSSLSSINLSSFNTQNVTDMGHMFSGCSSLTSLDLSNFNTENVTYAYMMLYDCSSLTTLDLSNLNTLNVAEMSWMFSCPALTTIISNNEKPSPLKVGTFSESFDNRANCTLVVPAGTKALYAAADGWNELGKISEGNGQDDAYDEFMDLFAMLVDEFNYAKSQTVDNPQYNSNAKYEELVTETRGRFEDIWMHMMAIKEAAETVNAAGDTIAVREYIEDLVDVKSQIDETVNYFFSNIEDTNDAHGTSPLYLTSDEPFYNSGDYTAEKVTYTRHFSKHTKLHTSDGWETIILPFNVQKIVTEDGRLLAPFGSTLAQADVALPFWLAEMKDGQFVFATSIRANTPYIICMPNGDDINPKNCISGNVVFSASNTTVYASDKAQSVQGLEGFAFVPTYDFVEASDSVYAINDEVYSDGAVDYQPGSVFARNSRTVRPFEAYMQHDASSAFAPRFIPVMPDETDGIVTITPDTDKMSIYDLSGRKIDTMRKGVNIVVKDGKAVRIVKK